MYLLCWRRHGGLQYIGMSQDVDRRINAHRKAGRLPFAQLGGTSPSRGHETVFASCIRLPFSLDDDGNGCFVLVKSPIKKPYGVPRVQLEIGSPENSRAAVASAYENGDLLFVQWIGEFYALAIPFAIATRTGPPRVGLIVFVKRPRFSWTRIKGESNVQGGGGNGSVEGRSTGRGIGAAMARFEIWYMDFSSSQPSSPARENSSAYICSSTATWDI